MLCPKVGVVPCPAPLDGAPPACLLGLELGRQEVARVRLGLALSLGGVLQAGGRRGVAVAVVSVEGCSRL